jgi:hypothetical protein
MRGGSARSHRRIRPCLVALLAAFTGCGDDDSEPAAPTSTTSTTGVPSTSTETTDRVVTTTTAAGATDDEEALILERYLAYWDARFEVNEDPASADVGLLDEFATGAQLDAARAEASRLDSEGLAFRLPPNSVTRREPRVVSLADGVAEIQDCDINDGILYRTSTGEVVDDSVVTRNVSAVMRLVEGEWRLESATVLQQWDGVAGCALD